MTGRCRSIMRNRLPKGVRFRLAIAAILAGAVVGGLVLPSAALGSSDDQATEPMMMDLPTPDIARAMLEGGVTRAEHEAAVGRLIECMGDVATTNLVLERAGELLGYVIHSSSDAEMDRIMGVHDPCYEQVLMEIDITYQLAIEEK